MGKAAKEYKGYWHKIKSGESLYSISQLYGIRIESLYKMNYKDDSYVPVVGDLLRVRWNKSNLGLRACRMASLKGDCHPYSLQCSMQDNHIFTHSK